MTPLSVLRGRHLASLFFVLVLIISIACLVGVARADNTNALRVRVDPQSSSVNVSARDLGDFGSTPPAVSSPSALAVNLRTGKVLYDKNSGLKLPMASTTKIMTAVLVLEKMDLGAQLTVSASAAQTWEMETWVRTGDVLTVEQLLYALIVASANQAAVVLAEGCSGSVEAFVQEMNAKAAGLGLSGTHYANPHGLDADGHYSTAADLATLARYAINSEAIGDTFRKLVQTRQYSTQIAGHSSPTVFTTTNDLMLQYDWVTGVKTGETPKALTCLVATGTKENVSVLSVVLGQPVHEQCFRESRMLLEYGISQYRYVSLLEQATPLAEAALPYHLDEKLRLVTKSAVGVELYKEDTVTASVIVDRALVLPVAEGEVFGRVELSVGGSVIDTVDLVASASVGKTTLGTKIAYYLTRFGRWVKGS